MTNLIKLFGGFIMFKKKNFIAPLAVILAPTSLSTSSASAEENNTGSNNLERKAVIKSVKLVSKIFLIRFVIPLAKLSIQIAHFY